MTKYIPNPIASTKIKLPTEIVSLTELLMEKGV